MIPKERAYDLMIKYFKLSYCIDTRERHNNAKDCALVAVNEVLEATKKYDFTLGPNPSYNEYWLKVKYQIEQL